MATGDKIVTLDGLKAVYDSQDTDGIKQDISDLKSSVNNTIIETETDIDSIHVIHDAVEGAVGISVELVSKQDGSGTVSPENIRPLSGSDHVTISVSPTVDSADGTDSTINFPAEVGGVAAGHLDVDENGDAQIQKTHAFFEFDGTENWIAVSSSLLDLFQYNTQDINMPVPSYAAVPPTTSVICSHYPNSSRSQLSAKSSVGIGILNANAFYFYAGPNITSVDDWKAYLASQKQNGTPVQVVAPAAQTTSQSFETQPVELLDGTNYVRTSIGVFSVNYKASVQRFVEYQIGQADFETNYKKYAKTQVISQLAVGLPILSLYGDTTGISKDNAVDLSYSYGDLSGNCTLKWQGSSSISYEKKNYTIKFDNDINFVNDWGDHKKYCLKANYIDCSHARNVCGAKLWGRIVKNRSVAVSELNSLVNGGAVDGFPIMVSLNGEFHGLYTLNIPKDEWMFNMTGQSSAEAIVSAEDHTNPTQFKATVSAADLEAETSFSVEYMPDSNSYSAVASSLSTAISAVMNATSASDRDTINQYIDIPSAIDYYIFVCLLGAMDCTDKNYLLVTFNGTKWYFSAYDLDSTFGNYWTGGFYIGAGDSPRFATYATLHNLMGYIYTYCRAELKSRFNQLINGVMSPNAIEQVVNSFICEIPQEVKTIDQKKWTHIPGTSTNNASQIVNWYNHRVSVLTAELNALT